jgi:hypothetical protein
MADRKRISVTLSTQNLEKLEETAERYGITVNAFMAFVLGQWVDTHFEKQREMSEEVDQMLSSPDDLFKHPQLLEMVKEILKNDEDFKKQASKELKEG